MSPYYLIVPWQSSGPVFRNPWGQRRHAIHVLVHMNVSLPLFSPRKQPHVIHIQGSCRSLLPCQHTLCQNPIPRFLDFHNPASPISHGSQYCVLGWLMDTRKKTHMWVFGWDEMRWCFWDLSLSSWFIHRKHKRGMSGGLTGSKLVESGLVEPRSPAPSMHPLDTKVVSFNGH